MLNYKILLITLSIILFFGLIGGAWLMQKNEVFNFSTTGSISVSSFLAEPALAKDIYPLFFCPCCGQPLDKRNICCGLAEERISYIDSLADEKEVKDEIILAFIKKYGLNSFINENKQEEVREKLAALAPEERPQIVIESEVYDFGDISQEAGNVFAYFELKNEGEKDLIIDKMDTSCGCTFVSIIYKDKESPFFTMSGHGYENPEWKGITIPAGQAAQLKITYDPDVHGEFRGFAIREIYIYSNDPIDFEKKIKIELNQIP